MKNRIWELDAFRGILVIGMILVHLAYDLFDLFRVMAPHAPALYRFFLDWGGVLFLLVSGLSITLSTHYLRRGFWVLCFGMVCTAVTAGIYWLGFTDSGIIIYFGVLHCLGTCMLVWPLFKKLPVWALALISTVMIVLGIYVNQNVTVDFPWLIALGLMPGGFSSSDYFPLLPNLGFFLAGALIGKTLYRRRESLMPNVNTANPFVRAFIFCGKHSLSIYLLHQPVLVACIGLVLFLI